MRSFKHFAPALRLFHGPDSFSSLGAELDRLRAKRALVFCGASMAREGRVLSAVKAALGERCAGVFEGVRAHSPVPSVEEGAREIKRLGVDAAIALGGGSAMVTARAASILAAEAGDAKSLSTSRNERGELHSPKLNAPKVPQLVIPTTPTTAIVKAGSAVFDPVAKARLALFDPKTRAHSVFIHPDALMTAPNDLIVSASLDTLVLAVEGLTSRGGDPLADAALIHAVRLVNMNLDNRAGLDDRSRRGDLTLAAMLAGQGTDYTGAGIATALGHAIAHYSEAENGVTKAIVLPHALRFNRDAIQSGIDKLAASFDIAPGTAGALETIIEKLQRLSAQAGIPHRLRDAGVSRDVLRKIADNTMMDWWLRANPRPVRSADEALEVLEQAW